jgi:hypothetical protein
LSSFARFCPGCNHKSLLSELGEKLGELDILLKKTEAERRRKERLAFVNQSLSKCVSLLTTVTTDLDDDYQLWILVWILAPAEGRWPLATSLCWWASATLGPTDPFFLQCSCAQNNILCIFHTLTLIRNV